MNVNKKFDRLRQWGKERMGGEVATTTTDDFRALETEMDLRHQGMDRLQQSTSAYLKSLSTRTEGTTKDKALPVAHFGATLASHGDDFDPDSEFGSCLLALGRANERIARIQETYCANATSSWLESVERSQVQMKEYQAARKKLESRRLAYDTATVKVQKAKREDFRVEEELRTQKMKYEESQDEVVRRMMDIKEAEGDSVADLTSFLEAECAYYERCREVLVQLRRDWPATQSSISSRTSTASPVPGLPRRNTTRSRASSITNDRITRISEESGLEPLDPPPALRGGSARSISAQNSPRRELPGFDFPVQSSGRPVISRSNSGFTNTTAAAINGSSSALSRDQSPAPPPVMPRLSRMPTEPTHLLSRNALRVTKRGEDTVFGDDNQSDLSDSVSGSDFERKGSATWSVGDTAAVVGGAGGGLAKRPPPPPPPSRATKPPPPLPVKRSALGGGGGEGAYR